MPKVERATADEKELAAAIRGDHGGAFALTLAQVGKVIGAKSPHTARAWVKSLFPREINGRRAFLVSDVAHKLLYGEGGNSR